MTAPVYLDHNATSPLAPEVLEAMLPWLTQQFGNASSRHEYGRTARHALDEARQRVASLVNAHESEIVFTSSGSEANNLFIKGAARRMAPGVIAISAIEHPSVYQPARQLRHEGWQVIEVAADATGQISGTAFEEAVALRPRLVSLMLANNETGAIQPVAEFAQKARDAGSLFHTDVTQAVGRVKVDFRDLNQRGVNALTFSAHKLGGPKGAAALVIDKRVDIEPLISGGGHERGLHAGTENIAAIVGFGVACEVVARQIQQRSASLVALRNRLEKGLHDLGVTVFSSSVERLPNTTFFALPALDGETLVAQLDRAGFAVASGAACSSHQPGVSHVLTAMHVAEDIARGAVRISLGAGNTMEQIDDFLVTLSDTVRNLRQLTAVAA